jgi:Zn-dependent peptidase ImmA (M78 family)
MTTAPIDPLEMATQLGVQVYSASFEDDRDGMLDWKDSHPEIFVNEAHPNQQRFTIAHELGHLFTGPTGATYRGGNQFDAHSEGKANAFAADVLMPSWLVKAACLKYGKNPLLLSRVFGVSEQAMGIRLTVLGL